MVLDLRNSLETITFCLPLLFGVPEQKKDCDLWALFFGFGILDLILL